MPAQTFLQTYPDTYITAEWLVPRESGKAKGTHFRIPSLPFIGQGAKDLYQREKRMKTSIRAMALELQKVLEILPPLYWTHTMPETLGSVLDSFERGSAVAAAIGFLRQQGFEVSIPKPASTAEQIMDRVLDDETTGEAGTAGTVVVSLNDYEVVGCDAPPGVAVIVHQYDVQDHDDDDPRMETDDEGAKYLAIRLK